MLAANFFVRRQPVQMGQQFGFISQAHEVIAEHFVGSQRRLFAGRQADQQAGDDRTVSIQNSRIESQSPGDADSTDAGSRAHVSKTGRTARSSSGNGKSTRSLRPARPANWSPARGLWWRRSVCVRPVWDAPRPSQRSAAPDDRDARSASISANRADRRRLPAHRLPAHLRRVRGLRRPQSGGCFDSLLKMRQT